MLSRIKRLNGTVNSKFTESTSKKVNHRAAGVLKVITAYQKGSFKPESVKGNVYNSTKTVFIKLA